MTSETAVFDTDSYSRRDCKRCRGLMQRRIDHIGRRSWHCEQCGARQRG